MNEIQSVQAFFIIEKGEKLIYRKFSRDFKGDKDAIEETVAATMEENQYTKDKKVEIITVKGFALVFKVFKDFTISFLTEQDSENQVFISEAIEALERSLKSVNL